MPIRSHRDPRAIWTESHQTGLQTRASVAAGAFGPVLTAYGIGLHDPAKTMGWATGDVDDLPENALDQRLRVAYAIAVLLTDIGEAPQTIQVWSMGMNPDLYDRAPIQVLRDGELIAVWDAAKAWAGGA